MAERLRLRLLGPPKIEIEGASPVEPLSNKAQAVLYYLAATGQAGSRPALATLLWGDVPDATARANLRRVLVDLRRVLGSYLEIDRHTVALSGAAAVWSDVTAFEVALRSPGSDLALSPPEAERLQAAVDLYRGDFLQGFSVRHSPDFEAWMMTHRNRLRELMGQGLRVLAEHYLALEALGEGIAVNRHLLQLEPWREEAHRQLMRLLAGDGQRSAALAQFEVCRQALAETLNIAPAPETVALYERIRDGTLSRGAEGQGGRGETFSPARPLRRSPAFRPTLPAQPTPFIGRKQELADIIRRLTDRNCRLLTLVGPGGIGKTRLALQTAHTLLEAQPGQGFFAHGLLFVPLTEVSTSAGVVSAIASAASFLFYGRVALQQQLLDFLRDKEMLLVLDSFEHLLPSAAEETAAATELITAILAAAPGVKILVTSRKALNLQVAWFHPVEGMAFPASAGPAFPLNAPEDQPAALTELEKYDAVQLFGHSAARARGDFSLAAEREAVVRICRLVEGMPLALELAAAWLKVLPSEKIAAEIERGLDILTARHQNVPERQRSMRVVLAQAWQLLTEAEQKVFGQLSVFRGGFTAEAARVVAGARLPDLASMVDKAMLTVTAAGRYHLHELLRQYASQHLAQSPEAVEAAHRAHCAYYADFLDQLTQGLMGGEQRPGLEAIALERDNVWAAWQWAVREVDLAAMEKALLPLQISCQFQGKYQAGASAWEVAYQRLSTVAPSPSRQRVLLPLLVYWGWLLIRLGQLDKAETVISRSAELYRQLGLAAVPGYGTHPALALSLIATIRGDFDVAVPYGEQALRDSERDHHRENLYEAHYVLACAAFGRGDYHTAQDHAQQAYQLALAVDDHWFAAYCFNEVGKSALALGEVAVAQQHFESSYALRQELNDPEGTAVALNHLGEIALRQRDEARAGQLFHQSLTLYQNMADKGGLATTYHGLGLVASRQAEFQVAQQHLHRALQLAEEIHYVPLIYSILTASGDLLLKTGRVEAGLSVLNFVRQHASAQPAAQSEAQQLLARYGAEALGQPPATPRTLEEVVREVLQLTAGDFTGPGRLEAITDAG